MSKSTTSQKFSQEFRQKSQQILSVIESSKKSEDLLVEAKLVEYGCIEMVGFFDREIKKLIFNFCEKEKTNQYITNYVEKTLDKSSNFKTDLLINLLKKFNTQWGEEIKKHFDHIAKEQVNSLITVRNSLAHGEEIRITKQKLEEYSEGVSSFIEKVGEILR